MFNLQGLVLILIQVKFLKLHPVEFFKSSDFIAKTLFVITWFCDHSVDFLDIFLLACTF